MVDAANVLPPATEAALTTRLAELETRTGRQLVVATVPSLGDREIEVLIGLAGEGRYLVREAPESTLSH